MTVGALGAVRQKIGEIDLFLLPSQKWMCARSYSAVDDIVFFSYYFDYVIES